MPVVTPVAASIVTVNAVPNREVFVGVCACRPRASALGFGIARQISPRPYRAMKLMASGVTFSAAQTRSPSFSRASSSTRTMSLPERISARISSIGEKPTAVSP